MGQSKDLSQEKTVLNDNDVSALDDFQDSYKSKKWRFISFWNYIIGKFTATKAEIDAVCSGNTATAAEITQICDGRVAGGTGLSDLVTVGGTQNLANKGLETPYINGAVVNANGTQIDTLIYTTGTGRVNEVQQGLAVGNAIITFGQSMGSNNHGLTKFNFASDDSVNLPDPSNYSISEKLQLTNISSSAVITFNCLTGDHLYENGNQYSTVTLYPDHSLIITPHLTTWLIVARGKGTIS